MGHSNQTVVRNQQIHASSVENLVTGVTTAPTNNQSSTGSPKNPPKDKYSSFSVSAANKVQDNICNKNVKGSLSKNSKFWKEIGASHFGQDVIKEGYKLPFLETPKQASFLNNKSALSHGDFVQESVLKLKEQGRVKEILEVPTVLNPLSVNVNSSGKKRLILVTVLPFGLSTAPYIFTHVLRPFVSSWHDKGVKILVYLDDGAGSEKSYNLALTHSNFVRESLAKAGFIVNDEKSIWEPSRNLTWLGLTLNFDTKVIKVTEKRSNSISSA